jgi:phosphoglycerate dehydrogenase-like enzyme
MAPGPGHGPGGVPRAIAVSPILSARVRAEDLDRIRAAAPGARVVNLSVEGLADGPVDDVEVLLRGFLSSDAFDRLLARAPELGWVHSATSGVERALTPAALARDVVVTNARGVFSRPIAEHVLLMILAISRRLPQLLELQHERTWQPLEGRELRDLTIGIVGYGSLGRAVASLATAFGSRVIALRRNPASGEPSGTDDLDEEAFPVQPRLDAVFGPDALHAFLGQADIVVLAAPLTPETDGLIDEAAIAAMRRDAWLVNVARGRSRPDPGPRRGPPRRGRARHLPRGATASLVAAVGAAERHRDAAYLVVLGPGARSQHRPLLRQPPAIPRRRAAAERRRSGRRLLSG